MTAFHRDPEAIKAFVIFLMATAAMIFAAPAAVPYARKSRRSKKFSYSRRRRFLNSLADNSTAYSVFPYAHLIALVRSDRNRNYDMSPMMKFLLNPIDEAERKRCERMRKRHQQQCEDELPFLTVKRISDLFLESRLFLDRLFDPNLSVDKESDTTTPKKNKKDKRKQSRSLGTPHASAAAITLRQTQAERRKTAAAARLAALVQTRITPTIFTISEVPSVAMDFVTADEPSALFMESTPSDSFVHDVTEPCKLVPDDTDAPLDGNVRILVDIGQEEEFEKGTPVDRIRNLVSHVIPESEPPVPEKALEASAENISVNTETEEAVATKQEAIQLTGTVAIPKSLDIASIDEIEVPITLLPVVKIPRKERSLQILIEKQQKMRNAYKVPETTATEAEFLKYSLVIDIDAPLNLWSQAARIQKELFNILRRKSQIPQEIQGDEVIQVSSMKAVPIPDLCWSVLQTTSRIQSDKTKLIAESAEPAVFIQDDTNLKVTITVPDLSPAAVARIQAPIMPVLENAESLVEIDTPLILEQSQREELAIETNSVKLVEEIKTEIIEKIPSTVKDTSIPDAEEVQQTSDLNKTIVEIETLPCHPIVTSVKSDLGTLIKQMQSKELAAVTNPVEVKDELKLDTYSTAVSERAILSSPNSQSKGNLSAVSDESTADLQDTTNNQNIITVFKPTDFLSAAKLEDPTITTEEVSTPKSLGSRDKTGEDTFTSKPVDVATILKNLYPKIPTSKPATPLSYISKPDSVVEPVNAAAAVSVPMTPAAVAKTGESDFIKFRETFTSKPVDVNAILQDLQAKVQATKPVTSFGLIGKPDYGVEPVNAAAGVSVAKTLTAVEKKEESDFMKVCDTLTSEPVDDTVIFKDLEAKTPAPKPATSFSFIGKVDSIVEPVNTSAGVSVAKTLTVVEKTGESDFIKFRETFTSKPVDVNAILQDLQAKVQATKPVTSFSLIGKPDYGAKPVNAAAGVSVAKTLTVVEKKEESDIMKVCETLTSEPVDDTVIFKDLQAKTPAPKPATSFSFIGKVDSVVEPVNAAAGVSVAKTQTVVEKTEETKESDFTKFRETFSSTPADVTAILQDIVVEKMEECGSLRQTVVEKTEESDVMKFCETLTPEPVDDVVISKDVQAKMPAPEPVTSFSFIGKVDSGVEPVNAAAAISLPKTPAVIDKTKESDFTKFRETFSSTPADVTAILQDIVVEKMEECDFNELVSVAKTQTVVEKTEESDVMKVCETLTPEPVDDVVIFKDPQANVPAPKPATSSIFIGKVDFVEEVVNAAAAVSVPKTPAVVTLVEYESRVLFDERPRGEPVATNTNHIIIDVMKHYTDRTNTIVSSSPLNPCPAIAMPASVSSLPESTLTPLQVDVCVFKKNSQRQKLAVEAAPISETDMVNVQKKTQISTELGKLVDFAQDSIGLEIGVPASKQNIALSLTDKFLAVKLIETNPTLKNVVAPNSTTHMKAVEVHNFNENVTDTSGIVYSFCKAVLKLIYFVGLFVIFLSTVTRALYPRFVDANISRAPVNAKPGFIFRDYLKIKTFNGMKHLLSPFTVETDASQPHDKPNTQPAEITMQSKDFDESKIQVHRAQTRHVLSTRSGRFEHAQCKEVGNAMLNKNGHEDSVPFFMDNYISILAAHKDREITHFMATIYGEVHTLCVNLTSVCLRRLPGDFKVLQMCPLPCIHHSKPKTFLDAIANARFSLQSLHHRRIMRQEKTFDESDMDSEGFRNKVLQIKVCSPLPESRSLLDLVTYELEFWSNQFRLISRVVEQHFNSKPNVCTKVSAFKRCTNVRTLEDRFAKRDDRSFSYVTSPIVLRRTQSYIRSGDLFEMSIAKDYMCKREGLFQRNHICLIPTSPSITIKAPKAFNLYKVDEHELVEQVNSADFMSQKEGPFEDTTICFRNAGATSTKAKHVLHRDSIQCITSEIFNGCEGGFYLRHDITQPFATSMCKNGCQLEDTMMCLLSTLYAKQTPININNNASDSKPNPVISDSHAENSEHFAPKLSKAQEATERQYAPEAQREIVGISTYSSPESAQNTHMYASTPRGLEAQDDDDDFPRVPHSPRTMALRLRSLVLKFRRYAALHNTLPLWGRIDEIFTYIFPSWK